MDSNKSQNQVITSSRFVNQSLVNHHSAKICIAPYTEHGLEALINVKYDKQKEKMRFKNRHKIYKTRVCQNCEKKLFKILSSCGDWLSWKNVYI